MLKTTVYFGKIEMPLRAKEVDAKMYLKNQVMPLAVRLAGQRTAFLDTGNPRSGIWASMITLLQEENQPAYVEIDEDTKIVTRLCMPFVTEVIELFPEAEGSIEVALNMSDAMHSLRRDVPGFQEIYDLLLYAKKTGAPVLVTATPHDFGIIDVRLPALSRRSTEDDETELPLPPPMPIVPVSPDKAVELFNLVSATTCTVDSLESPCIPYKYPFSGCNVRAHLMCRLMIDEGATPEKIWIAPKLRASSPNAPKCIVGWAFHVAPTLLVLQADGPPMRMVIDPSLCDGPVTEAYWQSLQGNPKATLTNARWEYYDFLAVGTASPEKAERDMQKHRLWLAELWESDPPPYDCPPKEK